MPTPWEIAGLPEPTPPDPAKDPSIDIEDAANFIMKLVNPVVEDTRRMAGNFLKGSIGEDNLATVGKAVGSWADAMRAEKPLTPQTGTSTSPPDVGWHDPDLGLPSPIKSKRRGVSGGVTSAPSESTTGKSTRTAMVEPPTASTTKTGTTPVSSSVPGTSGGGPTASGGGAPRAAPSGAGTHPITGWTAQETYDITTATVGRPMSDSEMTAWLVAFSDEHNGAMPWQVGPFDPYNNFLDHLMALGDSERELAMGQASDFTKAGSEGNQYAQPGITPDFWGNAYYSRYRGPTYMAGPGGRIINTGSQYLMPGQMPGIDWPYQLATYGELAPRPYNIYRPAMDLSGSGGGQASNWGTAYHTPVNVGWW